mgnify:CR=1 FL=1
MRMTDKPKTGILYTSTLIPIEVTDTKQSRNKNEKFKTITFWDCDNRREVKTHVVSSFGNYTRWKKVINYDLSQSTGILQGNFKFKDIDVIDADSTFVMHTDVTWEDVAIIIGDVNER